MHDLLKKRFSLLKISSDKPILPKWIFRHDDILTKLEQAVPINQKKLINTINHFHFKGDFIWIHLKDRKYGEDFFVQAYPEPCIDGSITCRLSSLSASELEGYLFLNLFMLDGRSITFIPAQLKSIENNSFTMTLPEKGYCLGKRISTRYNCQASIVEISQSGFFAKGDLLDFSPHGFRVKASAESGSTYHWLNSDNHVNINLFQKNQMLFSGACRLIRQTDGLSSREIVLAPVVEQIKRFKRNTTRAQRLKVTPLFSITFEHPLSKKTIRRDIYDISITGFSILEDLKQGVLIPGLIIPNVEINCPGNIKMKCTAQVTSRQDDRRGNVRYGLAIRDMDFSTYSRLSHIVTNIMDPHVRIDHEVDMDELWEFLFESGFIYASKYNLLSPHREHFKETYRKLYKNNPQIAAHATYHHHGKIYGHVSMLKAFERTWMVHHLAARPIGKEHTGLAVLKQILNYYEGLYRLPSIQMSYMMFYFRPENRFPNLFFGGFARDLNNPRACSLDLFSYKNFPLTDQPLPLPDGWCLKECSQKEAAEAEKFYRNSSGGLLLDVLQLGHENDASIPLEKVYESYGLIRRWKTYALMQSSQLKAILLVNQASLGLNLSELLNSITILVTDPMNLPWSTLSSAIQQLSSVFEVKQIPVMIYPHTYLEEKSVSYEKKYLLWILDAQYGKNYLDYMQDKVKMKLSFIIKNIIQQAMKK
jgi:hypothetical protein